LVVPHTDGAGGTVEIQWSRAELDREPWLGIPPALTQTPSTMSSLAIAA
jgi:hypothetical protein